MKSTSPTPRAPGRLVQVLVALWFAVAAVDGLPLWERGRELVDPVLDKTGLWQGPWNLFAPDVDKINTRVAAHIYFEDGHIAHTGVAYACGDVIGWQVGQ